MNNEEKMAVYDSMSLIRAIGNINSKTKHETILNIQHIFTFLTNNDKDIIIAWVPSHQGIKGNEEADIAAKEVTSPSSDVIRRRIPYQDLVVTLHYAEKQSWNKIWNTFRRTKTHNITQDFYQTMPTHNMKRKDRIVMTRLRTGHCKLTHDKCHAQRQKYKITGSPDVAETHRKCPELSKGN
ncbi:uncharacterized protein LOC122538903 [Frieseomelitta varia]|uniref:uncharacterized protein LOC122538903 n=1 Tax=Frieseomelitta varia TaxID=561572 RepID=UPI001CB6B182|nr:uncharacterized protein LOC122538903 [Frieseomelitta varia]